jgi:hypothetical protein
MVGEEDGNHPIIEYIEDLIEAKESSIKDIPFTLHAGETCCRDN